MTEPRIVRFVPGQAINTDEVLEIVGLRHDAPAWREIEAKYPEIRAAGPEASFRGARNVTIFPPHYMPARTLRSVQHIAQGSHPTYFTVRGSRLTSVLVHVHGGYESLHIYRVRN